MSRSQNDQMLLNIFQMIGVNVDQFHGSERYQQLIVSLGLTEKSKQGSIHENRQK